MRLLYCVAIAASSAITSPLLAQGAGVTSWCSTSNAHVPVDSLRALALRYHAEAFNPEARRDSVLVGLILDSSCRVIEHAAGRYHSDRLGAENLLQTVIPSAQLQPFIVAGIAEATDDQAPGTPWIVWVSRPI